MFKISSHYTKCVPVEAIILDVLPFLCEHCEKGFSSKIGLGVHMQRCHPVEFDSLQNIIRRNQQWTDDEMRVMAIRGAEYLMLAVKPCGISQFLVRYLPAPTINMIKSQRKSRNIRYKTILADVMGNRKEQVIDPSLEDITNLTPISSDDTDIDPAEENLSLQNVSILSYFADEFVLQNIFLKYIETIEAS